MENTSIIVSNVSIDLSVGSIINYDQSTPFEFLNLEDIMLSECEEYWEGQSLTNEKMLSDGVLSIELPCCVKSAPNENQSSEFGDIESEKSFVYKCDDPWYEEVSSEDIVGESSHRTETLAGHREEPIVITENRSCEVDEANGVSVYVANETQKTALSQGELVSNGPIKSSFNIHANVKGSCDKTKMFVRPASDSKVKKLCCPFCLKCYSKLARHLASMHKAERDVKKFINLQKGSKERRHVQNDLRKLGLYKWNGNADLNKNELIPCRRPSGTDNVEGAKWTTCPHCLGPYTKTNLRHHVAKCHKNPVKGQRIISKLATIVDGQLHENASNRLATVMGFMRQDHIVQIIRYDWMLVIFGNKMCKKYTPHYQENMIRARLRLAGRLLFEIRQIDSNITDFASIYHVERYHPLVAAIKVIGRFDSEKNEFGAPAMASFAVTFMKQIGKYLCAEYILQRDRINKTEAEDFLTYMESDIDISINKLVAETQSKMRRRKEQNIPTMEDVKTLIRYINTERNACIEELSKEFSEKKWHRLGQLSMAWIIVFNRRRVGEVQNILVDEFLGRQSIDDVSNDQMMTALSEESKLIARKFKRMKIRGKKGRTVPVLLKPAINKGIEMFISHRQAAGVPSDSQYLFELPSSSNLKTRVVDGCNTLRKFSEACGAQNPTSLRGTTLRKHVATTCVSLELNDALVAEVAKFMGHSEKIHRDTYQQNTIDREVVQMANILEAAVGRCDVDDNDEEDDCVGGEVWPSVVDGKESPANETNALGVPDEKYDEEADTMQMLDERKRKSEQLTVEGEPVQKKCKRNPWTNEEISAVRKAFATHFKGVTLPVQAEIEDRQAETAYASLRSRTWQQIKAYVNNQKKKTK